MGRTSQEVGVMPKETIISPEVPEHPGAEARLGLSVGWNTIGWVQIHMEPANSESTGDWSIVDLDRDSINRLIRGLRKARDRAYGADA